MAELSSSGPVMIPGMTDVYNQLLGLNQQNYGNILGQYAAGQANLNSQLGSISQGYGQLEQGVFNTLGVNGQGWGVATPAANAIGRSFSQARGRTTQDMINSGLGGSTLAAQAQNQNAAMASRAYGELGNQLANTAAGYQSQINQARLGAQMQGLGMQTQLQQSLGSTLGGYHFANTAGNLTGQQSQSRSGVGGGGGGGGGGVSGSNGMLGWGGLGATATGWLNQGNGGLGYTGAFSQGGYGGAYAPPGTLGGGFYNQTDWPAIARGGAGLAGTAVGTPVGGDWNNPDYFNAMWDQAEG